MKQQSQPQYREPRAAVIFRHTKPPYQWDEPRHVYLTRRAAEYREKLAELEANGSPRGYAAYIHATRVNALKEQIAKFERNAALAKTDEKKPPAARKRP